MKILLLIILLAPSFAHAALPELVCDSDAKVNFHSRWILHSSVKLEAAEGMELPWTGRETITSGHDIRETLRNHFGMPELPENLADLRDADSYLAFRERSEKSPAATAILVDRDLVEGRESDGLVIVQKVERAPSQVKLTVFHCRSR